MMKKQLLLMDRAFRYFEANDIIPTPSQVVMKWTGHALYSSMKPYIDIVDSIKASEMAKMNFYNDFDKISHISEKSLKLFIIFAHRTYGKL